VGQENQDMTVAPGEQRTKLPGQGSWNRTDGSGQDTYGTGQLGQDIATGRDNVYENGTVS
jgi:hypothetical protein